ncbi:unnamed protein product, partial [Prorocentrum cordatum]
MTALAALSPPTWSCRSRAARAFGRRSNGEDATAGGKQQEPQAYYYPSLLGQSGDRAVFQRLMTELNFQDCWLNTGMKFDRTICLGSDELLARAPTYREIVTRLASHFRVRPIRSLTNLYRNGEDWCNLHSDQYKQGGYPIDLTIGCSFGE